jgi:hypothetical protein
MMYEIQQRGLSRKEKEIQAREGPPICIIMYLLEFLFCHLPIFLCALRFYKSTSKNYLDSEYIKKHSIIITSATYLSSGRIK